MTDVTPSAEALIFSFDLKERKGLLRLLASDDSTAEKINGAIARGKAALPPLKPSSAGAWEAMIPFAGDQETGERMFEVFWLFGFGLYL